MIKRIFNIIPEEFKAKQRLAVTLLVILQLLDFFSVIILLPIILTIFNPQQIGMSFTLPYLSILEAKPLSALGLVILVFIVKNFLSIKIIRFQSAHYYAISSKLSKNLLKNFLHKTLREVRAEKNSSLVKDIIFIPNNFVSYVLSSLIQLIADSFLMLLIIVGCAIINPIATFFLIVISTIIIIGLYVYDRNRLKSINREVEKKYNLNFSNLLNTVNGYVEIKINRLENYFLEKFDNSNSDINKMYGELTTNRLAKPKHTETFLIIIISFLFIASKYVIADNTLNLLFVSFLFAASIKIIPAINRILISITNLKSNLYTIDILEKNAVTPENKNRVNERVVFSNNIKLDNISCAYTPEKAILTNACLCIKKGENIGIFGESGTGKSTLINIMSTLLKPDSGTVSVDGTPINEVNGNAYLSKIAYVSQSPFILEGSIRENLLLDQFDLEPEMLESYLEMFEMKQIIDLLPEKLSTFIGSNGYSLSGGQLQRIAIVRALLRNPELLILDEAMNQLDNDLRNRIMLALRQKSLEEKMTIVSISHNQKELAAFCDVVYVLKDAVLNEVKL